MHGGTTRSSGGTVLCSRRPTMRSSKKNKRDAKGATGQRIRNPGPHSKWKATYILVAFPLSLSLSLFRLRHSIPAWQQRGKVTT